MGRILVGLYNIVSTYLLGWVLYFAVVALGLQVVTEAVVAPFGFERSGVFWQYASARLGVEALHLRLGVYLVVHAGLFVAVRGVLWRIAELLERGFDRVHARLSEVVRGRPGVAVFGRAVFTVGVTSILVPFVLQPTLVGGWTSGRSWLARGANLADGTASRYVVDSVVGAYRRSFVDPVESHGGLDESEVAEPSGPVDDGPDAPPAPAGVRPMMDRWDPVIERVSGGDPREFAYLKAFMWVESGGRQFAVSHTGCAGLMQFCSGTARSSPFRRVFGAGSVYACGCGPRCDTPDSVERALETGERRSIDGLASKFPCELTDARFDGEKSLRAAKLYIDELSARFEDNLLLMYIGYNSGPAVAGRVWRRVGRDPTAGLDAIEPHLAAAMRPYFPDSAHSRAKSLLGTHLPKLERAFDRYHDARRAHASSLPSDAMRASSSLRACVGRGVAARFGVVRRADVGSGPI